MSFALITGASRGIGSAIAEEFARRGKSLLLVARDEGSLNQVSEALAKKYGVKAFYLPADLSLPSTPNLIYDWCERNDHMPDVLVNNAGYGLSGAFDSYPLDEHIRMMEVNMSAIVKLTYLFLPYLKKQEKAYILNIASSAAYQATPFMGLYSATKSFVLNFSRALHIELKKTSVVVTCVSPGATDTAFNDRANIGKKGRDLAKKFQVPASEVAKQSVDAMYRGKTEEILGFLNKMGAFFAWILPKKTVEKTAAKIYQ